MIFGCKAFEIAIATKDRQFSLLKNGKIKSFWKKAEKRSNIVLSIELKHLLTWMLNCDPKGRPTLQQVLNHPWM
jgi:hypothetical protein